MSFAVIGTGNTGQAIAAYLALNNNDVKLYTSDLDKAKVLNETGLELKGVYSSKSTVFISTNMEETLRDVSYIIITTPSYAHRNIFEKMKPYLLENQTIIILPGYWGAMECVSILKDDIQKKNITVLESNAMPFISQADNKGTVYVNKVKQNVLLGSLENSNSRQVFEEINRIFPQFKPAKNILETSLNNTNVTVHVPVVLFNASRINAGEKFHFYRDGVSELTAEYIENLDKERVKLAEYCNVKTKSVLTLLNEFYNSEFDTLHEALPKLFPNAIAPITLDHRYIKEDIPYGLVPISELSKSCGLESPYTDSLINSASLLLNTNFRGAELDMGRVKEDYTMRILDAKQAVK